MVRRALVVARRRGQRRVQLEREAQGLAAEAAEAGLDRGEVDRVQPRRRAAGLVREPVALQLLNMCTLRL